MSNLKEDIIKDALQVSPAVGTTGGLYLYGIQLADVVGILSAILICVQIGYRVWKWKMEKQDREQAREKLSSDSSSSSDSSEHNPPV